MKAAIAALALLSAFSAQAMTTYTADLNGSVTHGVSPWECHPQSDCPVPITVITPWVGTVTVAVTNSRDGTYTGDDFLSLAMDSSFLRFTMDAFGHGSDFFVWPPLTSFTVSIQDSQIRSIDGLLYQYAEQSIIKFSFSGLTVAYDQPFLHH